jgi:hypothetical protein
MKMNTEKTTITITSRNSKSSSLPLRSVSRPSRTCWSATSRPLVNVIRCITACETDDLQSVRHATCNIGRFRKDLKEIIRFDLISN